MQVTLTGNVWKFGDNIDTDVIIPGRYCHIDDPAELAKYCLIDLDTEFVNKIQDGDIIVAGENFGCGSSREVAPLTIKAAGISCVIAKSFARIFYRNAINIGLPIFESVEAVENIEEGNTVEVNMETGAIVNKNSDMNFNSSPFPEFILNIIHKGGLLNKIKQEQA